MIFFGMAAKRDLKARFYSYNNLACLLQAVEGSVTTIDLRNETQVTGRIDHVDGFMNVNVIDAVVDFGDHQLKQFDTFFIASRQVRFVHIPKNVDMRAAVKRQLGMIDSEAASQKRRERERQGQQTHKSRTLDKRQKETLEMVRDMRREKEKEKQIEKLRTENKS